VKEKPAYEAPALNDLLRATEFEIVGCDLCQHLSERHRCPSNGGWKRPTLPAVDQVLRFWLAHGINPGVDGAHGHHAQALVDLLAFAKPDSGVSP
jgi:hypothetical protein